MKRVICMLLSACFLLLAACSAAQDAPSQDRFCGFYLAVGDKDSVPDVDRAVGTYDAKTLTVSFEDVEGYACLLAVDSQLDLTAMLLGQGVEGRGSLGVDVSSIEADWYLSEDEDRIIRPYSVYQTADGSLYLCKESAAFGTGIGTISATREWEEDGTPKSLDCVLHIQTIPALENVLIKQFSFGDQLVETAALTLEQWQDELELSSETAWLTVEEHSAGGTVKRTVYTAGDGVQEHSVWFLDKEGIGEEKVISFLTASESASQPQPV